MDNVKLGKRIREERSSLHLTQERLAEMMGISDSYLGQVERGERSITLDNLVKICNIFGVTLDYLLTDIITPNDDALSKELIQVLEGRSEKEKRMALDMLKVMFGHLDGK